MGADADHTLQDIISKEDEMSREKAKAYLDKMAVAGRFVRVEYLLLCGTFLMNHLGERV